MTLTTINIPLHLPENLHLTPDQLKIELATFFYKEYNLTPQQAGKLVGLNEADCEFLRVHLFEPGIFRTKEWATKAGSEMSNLLTVYQELVAIKEVARQFQGISQIVYLMCFELERSLVWMTTPFEFISEDTWNQIPGTERRLLLEIRGHAQTAKRNNELLQDILSIEIGKLEFNFGEISLREMIEAVFDELDVFKGSFELEFEIPDNLPNIWVDKHRIHQALFSFISNIVMSKNLKIKLTVEYDGGQWISIIIADNGDGFPVDHMEHFWRRPMSFADLKRGVGNIGRFEIAFGEYIIEKNGGDVKFEHQVGIGSTITIKLPACQNAS
jgi:signal transduction histidine kinase